MVNLVLATSNHASFASSIWSAWASAPYDLLLVTEVNMKAVKISFADWSQDGMIAAHSGILFPMSRYLTAVVKTLPFTAGPTQVTDGYQIASQKLSLPGVVDWNQHQSCVCSERTGLQWSLSFGWGDLILSCCFKGIYFSSSCLKFWGPWVPLG